MRHLILLAFYVAGSLYGGPLFGGDLRARQQELSAVSPAPDRAFTACVFDPRIGKRLCDSWWSSPESCQWVSILEYVASGDLDEAEKIFAETFGFDASLAARSLPGIVASAMPLSEDFSCAGRQRIELMELQMERMRLPLLEDHQLRAVLIGSTTMFDVPVLRSVLIADELPAEFLISVYRLGASWSGLRQQISHEWVQAYTLRDKPVGSELSRLVEVSAAPSKRRREAEAAEKQLEETFSVDEEASRARYLASLDHPQSQQERDVQVEMERLLAGIRGNEPDASRLEINAWAEAQEPSAVLDLAHLLASSGLALEGLKILDRLKSKLEMRSDEPQIRLLRAKADWLESWLWAELGQETQSRQVLQQEMKPQDPYRRFFFQNFPPPDDQGISNQIFQIGMSSRLPGADEGTAAPNSAVFDQFNAGLNTEEVRLVQLMEMGAPEEFAAEALAFVEKYPSYHHLDWLFRASSHFHYAGQKDKARTILERALTHLETQLGPFREEDTTRSLIDSRIQRFYSEAVRLAIVREGSEALSHAERGRAFTLRRLLGERERTEIQKAFEGQGDLEREIHQAERAARPDLDGLQKLRRQFELARLRHRLSGAAVLPSESVARWSPLEQQAKRGESFLAFYDTRGGIEDDLEKFFNKPLDQGQLVIWSINERSLWQSVQNRVAADWSNIDCWSQTVRWQQTDEGLRGLARVRGVRILIECPGSAPGADPAEELYRMLIEPVVRTLSRGSRLVLVPHRNLHSVPFAALRNPETGRRLAEDFEISVVPSLDVLSRLRDRQASP